MGGLGGWLRKTFSSIPIVNTVLGAIGDVIEFLWTEVADPILEFRSEERRVGKEC